jgi:hypothetical protein
MYIPKWGSNFCFTFPTSEGSDLLSSHVMQTPTFISKLSDGNVIFRLDVGKKIINLFKNKIGHLPSALKLWLKFHYVLKFFKIQLFQNRKYLKMCQFQDFVKIVQE